MEQALLSQLNQNVIALTGKLGEIDAKMDAGMERLDIVSERLDNFNPCENCITARDMAELKPIVRTLNERRIGNDAKRSLITVASGAVGVVLGWLAALGIDPASWFRPSP